MSPPQVIYLPCHDRAPDAPGTERPITRVIPSISIQLPRTDRVRVLNSS